MPNKKIQPTAIAAADLGVKRKTMITQQVTAIALRCAI